MAAPRTAEIEWEETVRYCATVEYDRDDFEAWVAAGELPLSPVYEPSLLLGYLHERDPDVTDSWYEAVLDNGGGTFVSVDERELTAAKDVAVEEVTA